MATERRRSRRAVLALALLAAPGLGAAGPAAQAPASPATGAPQVYAFTTSSRVTYTATHRLGKATATSNRIEGGVTVVGTEIATPFTLRVPIASFRGVPTRDLTARQALGGPRHPDAVLVVEKLDLAWKTFVPGAVGGRLDFKGMAHGKLTLRGVTRPIAIEASGWAMPVDASVHATFAVSLKEFGIPAPTWLLAPVADRVEVEVEGVASRRAD